MRRVTGRRGPDRFDERRNLGLRIDLREQPQELALAPEARAPEDFRVPFTAEVRTDHEQAREVDLALGDGITELGVLAHQPGRLRTPERSILTQAQFVDAIRVQRRTRAEAVDTPPLYLAEVSKQVGERDVGSRREMLYGGKQLVVRNGRQRIAVGHVSSYTRDRNALRLTGERRSCARTSRDSNFARETVQLGCQTRKTASHDDLHMLAGAAREYRQDESTVIDRFRPRAEQRATHTAKATRF